jgi:hypothetical protein
MYEVNEQFEGYTLRCVFDFKKYPQSEYKIDFANFLRYQKLKVRTKNSSDLRVWDALVGKISFEDFKEKSTALFAKSVFYILKTNKELIPSKDYTINITVKRAIAREWYIVYDPDNKNNTPKQANFDLAGIFLINNIVAPILYEKRIDYTSIYKYITEYLAIHMDKMRGKYDIEDKATEFVKTVAQKQESYNIKYLYETLNNLRDTGFPSFKTKINNPIQEIRFDGIVIFNKNIQKFVKMQSDEKSKKFYEKNIGFENLTESGEVANGGYMCLTILLAIAKQMNSPITIVTNNIETDLKNITSINEIFRSYGTIKIKNIDWQIIDSASKTISHTNSDNFLKLYEDACDTLGISDEFRVMTRARYARLYKNIQDNSRQNRWYNKIKWFGK